MNADLTRKDRLLIADCLNERAQRYENRAQNILLGAIKGDHVVFRNAAGEMRTLSRKLIEPLTE